MCDKGSTHAEDILIAPVVFMGVDKVQDENRGAQANRRSDNAEDKLRDLDGVPMNTAQNETQIEENTS